MGVRAQPACGSHCKQAGARPGAELTVALLCSSVAPNQHTQHSHRACAAEAV